MVEKRKAYLSRATSHKPNPTNRAEPKWAEPKLAEPVQWFKFEIPNVCTARPSIYTPQLPPTVFSLTHHTTLSLSLTHFLSHHHQSHTRHRLHGRFPPRPPPAQPLAVPRSVVASDKPRRPVERGDPATLPAGLLAAAASSAAEGGEAAAAAAARENRLQKVAAPGGAVLLRTTLGGCTLR